MTQDRPVAGADPQLLRAMLDAELAARPPVIGVAGVSGSGKTATIEALFHPEIVIGGGPPIDARGWAAPPAIGPVPATPESVRLRVVDAPGLGEDDTRDAEYLAMYNRELWACDVVLWVFPARSRAVALDQRYLSRLTRFADRMVFGLNQVDLVEPGDWDPAGNLPSPRQAVRIDDVAEHRAALVSRTLRRRVPVVPYSAATGYRLDALYVAILRALPPARREVFRAIHRAAATRELRSTGIGVGVAHSC